MKIQPEIIFYGAIGIAAGVFGYEVYKGLFGGTGVFAQAGNVLNSYAASSGYSGAVAAMAPTIAYDRARSDYAKSIGWNLTKGAPPAWPSRGDWENGTWLPYNPYPGPVGFTHKEYV